MKFLLVEDDRELAQAIEKQLSDHCHVMDLATDGVMGKALAEAEAYDLILLDWTLPQLEGDQLCKQLRQAGNYTPILMMTSRNASVDKVSGLDAGADDYLVKPFEFEELLARIRALLRRAEGLASPILQWGKLALDPSNRQVTCHSRPVALTPKEYALLELFLRNPNRVFSLDNLLDKAWAFDTPPGVGSVRTHIKGLRQKLKNTGLPDVIGTIYGLGYRLNAPEHPKSKANPTNSSTKRDRASIEDPACDPDRAPKKFPGIIDVAALWQPVRATYIQRVADMASQLRGLPTGLVEKVKRQQLMREAHTLAGSLGTFGFSDATHHCKVIENILRTNAYLSSQHVRQLSKLMAQVQDTLENATENGRRGAADRAQPTSWPTNRIQIGVLQSDNSWLDSLTKAAAGHQMQVNCLDGIAAAKRSLLSKTTRQKTPEEISQLNILLIDMTSSQQFADDSPSLKLLSQLKQSSVPTIALTTQLSLENKVKLARLGVESLIQGAMTPAEIASKVIETAARISHRTPQTEASPAEKILIVDDDPEMLNFLKMLLQPHGFQLNLLNNPQDFWQTIEQFEPDLVLLDVEMPEFSGLDLSRVLRSDSRWRDIPILFISAHTDAQTIQRVFSAGANDYIRKPVVVPELVVRLSKWLERSRTQRLRVQLS